MENLQKLIQNIEQVIVGKTQSIKLSIACLLAGGHLLIEDIPGTGKTTLALAIAKSIEANFSRIQFTPDLMPADITGVSLFNKENNDFEFRKGPIFHNIILADEINRGTPKVQSSLLEAMNEAQVTVDGKTYELPQPFFVIATQNPISFAGTFPLLTAQLDRFLLKISLGYLDSSQEMSMMKSQSQQHPIKNLQSVLHIEDILELREQVKKVVVDDNIYKYIIALANATRNTKEVAFGVSHRGSLSLFRICRAYALVSGRDYVLPDDIKELFLPTLLHRVVQSTDHHNNEFVEKFLLRVLEQTPVPL
ncbi:AAA family ATPase [Candidatus Uabimicrobium amorphum]|uniref:ATPase n=1 Tax=Uabimicrobium amorphum TaxID=2596890 RepID=A0A5S9F271_UABAM|nr:MoxR family ATPase [Candidatus Uabimicrobium amorphum]BBM83162.1 ATPase [Candidatus Uabimicrobium amorphum]